MSKGLKLIALLSHSLILLLLIPSTRVDGQISTPCTVSMVTSFTPCLNFITGSSNNGLSPTTSCCGSLKSIMETGMNCACLLITANVPISLPINRTLALSLPRACKISGVPILCKPSGSPLPAPGPMSLLGPTLPPTGDASSLSPRASKVSTATAPTPQSNVIEQLTPSVSPFEGPAKAVGIRPVLSPPATTTSMSNACASLSYLQHIFVLALLAFMTTPFNRFISI